MSKRRTRQRLEPGTDQECYGCRVVYAVSRATVRSAVVEQCGVIFVDGALVRAQPALLRWLVTMTMETVVAVVGDVPDPLEELADANLDEPVTETAVETLVQRRADRMAYLEAVDRYYRAVARGATGQELDAARAATDERAASLDAADWRAILDIIGE